jgi:hypothetical protein
MPAITTSRINVPYADRLLCETGLAQRGYQLLALYINGSAAFQLSRADELVEFDARQIAGAVRTLNAHIVARSTETPIIKGDALMAVPVCDRDALHAVLKAAVQDAASR